MVIELVERNLRYLNTCTPVLPAAARDAGCDTFVTADVKYHAFQDAAAMGLNLVDAGHFPTEDPVCDKLIERINAAFPEVLVQKSRVHGDVIRFHSDSI